MLRVNKKNRLGELVRLDKKEGVMDFLRKIRG